MIDLLILINQISPILILVIFLDTILGRKLQPKTNKAEPYFIVTFVILIVFIFILYFDLNNFLSMNLIALIIFILYNLTFKGSFNVKSMIIVITIEFFLISVLLTNFIYYILCFLSLKFFNLVPIVNFITNFYNVFLIFFVIAVLSYLDLYLDLYLEIYSSALMKTKFLLVFSGVNIFVFNILLYGHRVFYKYSYEVKFHVILILIFFLVFILLILLTIISKILSNECIIKSYLDTLENQLNVQLYHYDSFDKHLNNSKIIVHDTKHHILALEILLENNQFDEAKEYIKDIEKDLFSLQKSRICDNKIIDAILQYALMKCINQNIKFTHHVNLPSTINISNITLSVTFSNLITNAIESCNSITDPSIKKYISINGSIINNNLVVKIINSTDKKIVFSNNGLVKTTKQNKYNHGIGLLSVRTSIAKCNGNIIFNSNNNKFEVFFSIPLNT